MIRLVLCCFLGTIATNAVAQDCIVDDPTGTPLNVRERPNGRIVGALYNGATVYVKDLTMDNNGKRWAYIMPLQSGKSGWVYRAYLDCR